MKALGVDLAGLINAGKLELHYSEFGIGGGGRYSGVCPPRHLPPFLPHRGRAQ